MLKLTILWFASPKKFANPVWVNSCCVRVVMNVADVVTGA